MLNLNTSEKNWASTAAARFEHKLRAVRERSAEKIPNRAVDGVHNNKIFEGDRDDADGICWWTNGFWAGTNIMSFCPLSRIMWQPAARTGFQVIL